MPIASELATSCICIRTFIIYSNSVYAWHKSTSNLCITCICNKYLNISIYYHCPHGHLKNTLIPGTLSHSLRLYPHIIISAPSKWRFMLGRYDDSWHHALTVRCHQRGKKSSPVNHISSSNIWGDRLCNLLNQWEKLCVRMPSETVLNEHAHWHTSHACQSRVLHVLPSWALWQKPRSRISGQK